MDFLGLKTLTVIRNTCEMVKHTQGIDVDIDHLPLDDAKTYDLLNKAQYASACSNWNPAGCAICAGKFQISSVEHITALVALYRPGPMDLIPDFIKRRHGEVKIEYAASAARAHLPGNLRHFDLSGASDAGRASAGRLHARQRGFAAARHGQEEGRGNGQATRDVRQGLRPR